MGGSASAAARPPSVSPVCLIPIAMPRSHGGNHSTTALPVAGFSTLKPNPPRTRSVRSAARLALEAASAIMEPTMN